MLINSNDCASEIETDICIIGSGIGGGTLASKLAEYKINFTIIEAGGPGKQSTVVEKEHVGRDFGLRTTTSIQIGGTSNLWHGVLSPLDEIDFERREWIPESGWPINYNDLLPYYQEAASVLGIENFDNFSLNKLNADLSNKLDDLVFNRDILANKIFQQPVQPKNFRHVVTELTAKSSKNHCVYDAVALELVCDSGNDVIEKLIYGSGNGSKKVIKANKFIICSGALETPRLLLNSKLGNGQSIGDQGGNVGRYLMDHPMGNLCQIEFKTPQKAPIYSDYKYTTNVKIKSGLEMSVDSQEKLKLPNHNFFVRPSFVRGIDDESEKIKLSLLTIKDGRWNLKDVTKVLSNLNVIRQILAYKLSLNVEYKYADLFFVTEQIPNYESNVSLSDKKDRYGYNISKINWQLLPEDISGMKKMYSVLRDSVFPESKYTFTNALEDFNWGEICTSAVHHVGTARMSHSSKKGVIDTDQKVFDIKNLFISDGSIFTTAGNVNNGLTIAAFSCRLASYLDRNR